MVSAGPAGQQAGLERLFPASEGAFEVEGTDEQKAKARKVAMLASRTNFVLSIPMLLCMASASHGLPL